MSGRKLPRGSIIVTLIVFAVFLALTLLQIWIDHTAY